MDSNEAKNVGEVPVLLGAKLDQYHNLNEELDFLVRNTFCCFASIFIYNTILLTSSGNYQPSKILLIEMVTHWHSSSIIHPQKYAIEVCIFRFWNFKYCPTWFLFNQIFFLSKCRHFQICAVFHSGWGTLILLHMLPLVLQQQVSTAIMIKGCALENGTHTLDGI